MAANRGVNDTANLARIERMRAADPDLSERQAIFAVYGLVHGENSMRRVQVKLQARRKQVKAVLRASVTDVHEAAFPVSSETEDGEFTLTARVPLDCGMALVTATVDLGGRGRRGGGLSCNVVYAGPLARPAHPGPYAALDVLGVTHRVVDGVLVDGWLDSEAVRTLGLALQRAWLDAGIRESDCDGDLLSEAEAHEAARLGMAGLDRLRELVGEDGGCLVACYADAPQEIMRTVLVEGMDPARRSVLRALSTFAEVDLAATDDDVVAGYVGRPLDLLVRLLEDRCLGPGRSPTASDAAWLHGLIGRMNLPPVPRATMATLLRIRAAIDAHRCSDHLDAAGLVDLVGAALSAAQDGELVVDLLMNRLASGPDSALGYGALACRMREACDGDLVGAVMAVTTGVDAWCAEVARDLLVAGILDDAALATGDQRRAQNFVSEALVGARWLTLLEATARDMVCAGRTSDALAAAVMRRGPCASSAVPFRLFGSAMSDVVSDIVSPLANEHALERAWARHAPHLVPRWRVGGREAWADRVRESFRDAGTGRKTVVGTFRRGVRSIVGRVEAGLGGEGAPEQAARIAGAARGTAF